MDGTCIYLVIFGMALARVFGVDINGGMMLSMFFSVFVLSVGAPVRFLQAEHSTVSEVQTGIQAPLLELLAPSRVTNKQANKTGGKPSALTKFFLSLASHFLRMPRPHAVNSPSRPLFRRGDVKWCHEQELRCR